MSRNKSFLTRMITAANLDVDLVPGLPILELAGHDRLLIEKYLSVLEYQKDEICVKMEYGTLCITGINLQIERMVSDQLIILGAIRCIQIIRKE